jgi:hypothetical protein
MAAQGCCACPDHGTDACTCQFAVLLAYGRPIGPPTVITVHSSGACTYVSLVEEPDSSADAEPAERVRTAVREVVEFALASLDPVSCDNSSEEVKP